jgi:uncharacterized membrane-anchored protein
MDDERNAAAEPTEVEVQERQNELSASLAKEQSLVKKQMELLVEEQHLHISIKKAELHSKLMKLADQNASIEEMKATVL